VELLDRLGRSAPALDGVVGLAHDDPVHPGREARVAAEAGERPPGGDQPLLDAVVGVGLRQRHAQGERVELVLMPHDELLERPLVPARSTARERLV